MGDLDRSEDGGEDHQQMFRHKLLFLTEYPGLTTSLLLSSYFHEKSLLLKQIFPDKYIAFLGIYEW